MRTPEPNLLLVILCAAFLFLMAPLARSTVLARLSLSQLVSAAHSIVLAQAVSNQPLWHTGEIWTVTTFRVLETWKGHARRKTEVWMLGGQAGRITSYVPGAPRFHEGEQVILFLEPMRDGQTSITAWGEGTFRIFRDSATGRARVTQDTALIPEFLPPALPTPHDGIRDWPLEKFEARVLKSIAAKARRKK